MTATATPTRRGQSHTPAIKPNARVTFGGALVSEWIKFTAIRSTPWIIATTVAVMVAFSALTAWSMSFLLGDPSLAAEAGAVPPASGVGDPQVGVIAATTGYVFGQIVVAILGVMIISGEYSTGQIRSTFSAVPKRLPVLASKAIVVGVTAFLTGAVAVALGALVSTPFLSEYGAAVDLGADGVVRTLLSVPLYLAAVAQFSLGVGAILRSTAGGIAVTVVLFFVLPLVWVSLSQSFFVETAPYLPSEAGGALINNAGDDAPLSAWQGYAVMLGWVALSLIAAAIVTKRRDA